MKNGRYPVYLRITRDRKHKRTRTGISLAKLSDWNPAGAGRHRWVRASEKDAAFFNDCLTDELEKARRIYRDNGGIGPDKRETGGFLDYARALTERLAAQGASNAGQYGSFCLRLGDFLSEKGRSDIAFGEITPSLLDEFEFFLRNTRDKRTKSQEKRLSANYIRTLMVKFRAIVNRAVKESLMAGEAYPFHIYTLPKEEAGAREALNERELSAISSLEYEKGSGLYDTKNAFLFSFYCAGMRAGDLLTLRWRNVRDGGRVEYRMGKNHKCRNYCLVPQALEILKLYHRADSGPSDFIFPFLDGSADYATDTAVDTMPAEKKLRLLGKIKSRTAAMDKWLKIIAVDAGIDKCLSFHISRHSFANLAREKAVPSQVVQEALAHSSLLTTERYLHSFSTEEVDAAMREMFRRSFADKM